MLIELKCEQFREKRIAFHEGLNVVLGDNVATNSIGKSTLLMVLDFVFGGETFLDHNIDVVNELGDHEYFFKFRFNSQEYYFKRSTFTPDLIYICSEKYEESKPITIGDYKDFLKESYSTNDIELSFRSFVSLFSRVWGKENLDVKHALHSFKNQRSSDCVENLLKVFKKYDPIRSLASEVKRKNEEKSALNNAFKENLIPKITKPQYKKSLNLISNIKEEIEDIKANLAKYAMNINEISNREVLELKEQKDVLLSEKSILDSRLSRIKSDLSQNKHIKSKHFKTLTKFFPNIEMDRLSLVEEFHSKISKILRNELQESEKELSDMLHIITNEIQKIDKKIALTLKNLDNPTFIVDRVYELSKTHTSTSSEIEYFETESKIRSELKDAKEELSKEKTRLLKFIEDVINDKTRKYVNAIYSEKRRSPVLTLSQNSYTFEAVEDTGTGKAYSNLILLDLAFFETTKLPFLIHDSLLFKNIENEAVAKLIDLYESLGKQTFIAIDEINKYGKTAESNLYQRRVIELSNDSVLYIKDWRK